MDGGVLVQLRLGDATDEELPMHEDELVAAALAADPDAVVPDDAVCLWDLVEGGSGLLPEWYMPAPMGGQLRGRRDHVARITIGFIIASFIVIQ